MILSEKTTSKNLATLKISKLGKHASSKDAGKSVDDIIVSIPKRLDYPIIAFILDTLIVSGIFIFLSQVLNVQFQSSIFNISMPVVLGAMTVIWLSSLIARSSYKIEQYHDFFKEFGYNIKGTVLGIVISSSLLYLLQIELDRRLIVSHAALAISMMIAWRAVWELLAYINYTSNLKLPRNILVVGTDELINPMIETVNKLSPQYSRLKGVVTNQSSVKNANLLGTLQDDFRKIVQDNQIDDVIIVLSREHDAVQDRVLKILDSLSIPAFIAPAHSKITYLKNYKNLEDLPLVRIQKPRFGLFSLFMKRFMDMTCALIGIILTLPIQLVIVAAIKLESRGPILFVQERVGVNGKTFRIFKFRSMEIDADKRLDEVSEFDETGRITNHKRMDDPRVTRVGKFIRKTSLDELPQLFNILLGDMTLVGPRPELIRLVKEYEPWQRHRFAVRQGLTGWWQINGRSEHPCHLSTDQDVVYINNFSFLLDIMIILMTVPALLKGKGAF